MTISLSFEAWGAVIAIKGNFGYFLVVPAWSIIILEKSLGWGW
jgi:hypothetical protein